MSTRRPGILYVSYDGALEPLGQSQVLSYLERLADSHDIALVSFEKDRAGIEELRERLTALGIRWVPLAYHRRPPIASTAWDVLRGVREIRRELRRHPIDVIHARSYVPALMALRARSAGRPPLVFDIRGFWVDERVDGGLWRRGALYRLARRTERKLYREADAVVTLTAASVEAIRGWTAPDVPIRVIPTCVDHRRFQQSAARSSGPHAVWNGSIGTWYRFDLAVRLAAALQAPLTVLTRQTDLAREALNSAPADVRTVAPANVPDELHERDIGLCLYQESFSKIASTPTRFAEYLAAGMPVALTPGLGDLPDLVTRAGVGVVLQGEDQRALDQAASELRRLADDTGTASRCRELARQHFDVSDGARSYAALYGELAPALVP